MGSINNSSIIPDSSTLHLPRILCLHGGGVNALIFKLQLRAFLAHKSLAGRFRFVFVDAPYLCEPGAGVLPVYADCGPCRRWNRWLPEHEEIEDRKARTEILGVCLDAMEEDSERGANGEWVGLIGFSQGAKIVASLLYEMQVKDEEGGSGAGAGGLNVQWRFGIVLAGRAPMVALSERTEEFAWLQKAGGLPKDVNLEAIEEHPEMRLRIPTIHVHGLKDEGLVLHRKLVDDYCAPGTTTLIEWDGAHRVMFKMSDVNQVVDAIVEVADEYGI